MDEQQLRGLIAAGETDKVELKAALSSERKRDICKEIAALASADGGILVIGASDDGELIGVSDPVRIAEQVSSWVGELVTPAPLFDYEIVQLDGKDLVVFTVREHLASLFFYDGRPYVRVAKQSRPATPSQVDYLVVTGRLVREIKAQAAEVVALGRDMQPGRWTAAAITGQGELATMNYPELLAKLREDLAG